MEQILYDRIFLYLSKGKLPEGFSWAQKASLRYDSRDYGVEKGQLVYKKNNSKVRYIADYVGKCAGIINR